MTDLHTLHDAGVIIKPRESLAHSLSDEVHQPYEWQPYRFHWTDAIKFVVGMVLVYGLFVALVVIGTAAS